VGEKVGERTVYESVPRYVERRVRQGEEERWVLERVPPPPTPQPSSEPAITPEPQKADLNKWSHSYLDESRDRRGGGLIAPDELSARELLEVFTDRWSEPSTWWDAVIERRFAEALKKVEGLPDITIALPWLHGFGPPLQKELLNNPAYLEFLEDTGGTLIKRIDTDIAIRTLGRTLGDDVFGPLAPVLMSLGWAISLAPEQIENWNKGAPLSEYLADAIVDTGGFVISEVAGDLAGLGTEAWTGNPALALGAQFVGDIGIGVAYDLLIRDLEARDRLRQEIEALLTADGAHKENWLQREKEIRVPTPGPDQDVRPGETPQPPE
jgi:hypothetical protein